MATKKAFLPIVLGLLLQGIVTCSAQQYLINLTATYKSTNSAGVIVTTKMTTPTLLNEIFADVPTARLHQLVYDVQTGEVLVVQKATGEALGAWFVFDTATAVTSGDGTKAEVYFDVSVPSDENYEGAGVGTVQVTRVGDEITKFKMAGKFTLRYEGPEGTPSRVYSGVFTTGALYVAPQ